MPAAFRIPQGVDGAMGWPSRASSPWILRCPHRGFSPAKRSTSFLSAAAVGGRPLWTLSSRSGSPSMTFNVCSRKLSTIAAARAGPIPRTMPEAR
jgi:hypothetical protein